MSHLDYEKITFKDVLELVDPDKEPKLYEFVQGITFFI
jgi:hypothetical protein